MYGFIKEKDQWAKVSENFHFDMTPQNIRIKFKEAYRVFMEDQSDPSENKKSLRLDPGTNLKQCMFNVSQELQSQELYFVFQITKVLTGDGEKATLPYRGAYSTHVDTKHEEICRRLHYHRQHLGIGVIKVFDDEGRVGMSGGPGLKFVLFAPKTCMNDSTIGQVD